MITISCISWPLIFSSSACAASACAASAWRWGRSLDWAQAFWLPVAFATGKLGAEFGGLLGIELCEFFLFTGIDGKVAELKILTVVKFDQLPVAIADGGAGFPHRTVVVRVMSVERALTGVVTLELGHEALAINAEE